ncbi:MAG: shikimate kinase [Candidatus Binatia bacterium]
MLSRGPKNIALTGFMAAGKTVVGRQLALRLDWPFVDLDRAIEEAEGMKVREIFAHKGEAFFRALEKRKLREVLDGEGQVVATGGGAVVDEENLRLLKEKSLLICLSATPEKLVQRAGSGRGRPLLKGEDRKGKIDSLLSRREKIYAQAHLTIDTSALSIDDVVEKIMAQLRITEGNVRIRRS